MTACKCGHAPAEHLSTSGMCTAIDCCCDSYVERPRIMSAEACKLADTIMGDGSGLDFTAAWSRAARSAQDLIDQRAAWENEAASLLAQRDYAHARIADLEGKLDRLAAAEDAAVSSEQAALNRALERDRRIRRALRTTVVAAILTLVITAITLLIGTHFGPPR